MAISFVIQSVEQPLVAPVTTAGTVGELELLAGLRVIVARAAYGAAPFPIDLAFADYTGLEVEWAAGTATTVLQAALAAALAAGGFNESTQSAAQKALYNISISVAE